VDRIGVVLGEATSAKIDENFNTHLILYAALGILPTPFSHANSNTNSVHELQTQRTGPMVISSNTSLMSMPISIETPSLETTTRQ
jgi:hypothetical protein